MYISKSNLNKLLDSVQGDPEHLDNLYHSDLRFCLSNAESDFLIKAKTFFVSSNRLALMFDPIVPKDNLRYIFPAQAPAYHLNSECSRLKSNWVNYRIPQEIEARGAAEILKFRKYILDSIKQDNLTLEHPALIHALRVQFQITDPTFGRVSKDNSGSVEFGETLEQANLTYIQHALDTVYAELLTFKDASDIHRKIYEMRYFDPLKIKRMTKYSSDEEREIAQQFSELKAKLIIALIESYKKENNFDQNQIEENLLINLGFHKCSACR